MYRCRRRTWFVVLGVQISLGRRRGKAKKEMDEALPSWQRRIGSRSSPAKREQFSLK